MLNMLLAVKPYVWWLIAVSIVVIVITVLVVILPFKIYFRALISGAYVGFFKLIGMQLRKTRPDIIVEAYINAKKAGLRLTIEELETHFMAGGDVIKVTNALIMAYNAHITLSPATAKAIDLAGRDVYMAVKDSVKPRVREIPEISAVAGDGIELLIRVRVTYRINISRLIGGADDNTLEAKIGEAVVAAVGKAQSYTDVMKFPENISSEVKATQPGHATALEVLDISISSINVGKNVKAELDTIDAETKKKVGQAKAEERRAMAIADEQEMRARTQEMKAQMILAESEVPKAMAEAFRNGKITVEDYYNLQNVAADTQMRKSLGSEDSDEGDDGGFPSFMGK